MYRIKSLQPGTSYEVDLVGQNSVGQSNPYVVVFQTSALIGTSGKLLGEPISQYLHGNNGNQISIKWILLLVSLVMRLFTMSPPNRLLWDIRSLPDTTAIFLQVITHSVIYSLPFLIALFGVVHMFAFTRWRLFPTLLELFMSSNFP